MNKELLQDAIDCYGLDVVEEVRDAVYMADPDSVHTMYEDLDMPFHAECVEVLYFEDEW